MAEGHDVHLIDLKKNYGGRVRALDGFSCTLHGGEMVVLLGPSGCGKTTALRALAGLEDIDSGRVVVGGADITATPAAKRDMAMVFQAYSLFPHLTAAENVEFGLRIRGIDQSARRKKALEQLELVGLADQAEKYTHQMSGGQQQRVALARALAIQPRVLLLDEPLSALDAKVRTQLRDEIRRIQKHAGITTLVVTHDQEEALAVADRIGVMNKGRLEQLGTPTEIYNTPATEFVASFVGSSNRVAAVSDGNSAEVWGSPIPLLAGSYVGDTELLIRPESLELVPLEGGVPEGAAPAIITEVSFLGSLTRVWARLESGDQMIAQLPASAGIRWAAGDAVGVRIAPNAVLAVARG